MHIKWVFHRVKTQNVMQLYSLLILLMLETEYSRFGGEYIPDCELDPKVTNVSTCMVLAVWNG